MAAVNKLAINLATDRVDYGYFQLQIVAQAIVTEVLRQFLAINDRFSIALELNAEIRSTTVNAPRSTAWIVPTAA
jgi:hypothetical protein